METNPKNIYVQQTHDDKNRLFINKPDNILSTNVHYILTTSNENFLVNFWSNLMRFTGALQLSFQSVN